MSDLDRPAVSRPLLIALGAIAGVAVLWLLVLGPMLTGGDADDDVVVPPVVRTPEPPVPGEDAPGDGGELYPETTEVFAARDPFAQLVSDGSGAAAGGGTTTTPGGTTTTPGGTASPGTPGDDGDGGGSGTGSAPPRNGSSAEVGGTRVKLVDVYDDDDDGEQRALVTVNGRSHDVAEGEAFGDRFRLLDLSGECGTFLFGDSRFVLCEGDEIRK